jgi:hypothetical protein
MSSPVEAKGLRRYATIIVALAVVAAFGVMARFPTTSKQQAAELASRFHFSKQPMPEVANHPAYKYVREVHPSLKRIASWISSLSHSLISMVMVCRTISFISIRAPMSSPLRLRPELAIAMRHSR